MKISLIGLLFGLLLLLVPLYIIYFFKLNVMRRFCIAMLRMAVAVGAIALVAWGAVALKSVVYDIVMFFVLTVVSAVFALGRARLNVGKLILPLGIGSIIGVAIITFYCLFLVLCLKNPFVPHIFVPFVGLVAGGIISVNAKALQTYYSGLQHHNQLYNYLLGNGGTHKEALRYFLRRCLQSAVVTVLKLMSRVVFLTAPVILLAMVMSGIDVFTAAAFQVIIYFSLASASLISILITFSLGQKYSFDEYGRLKPVVKTSSSPSKPLHTDSESQQQEVLPESHPQE